MTRAQDMLYLLFARQRRRFSGNGSGMSFHSIPSSFLKEIPAEYKSEKNTGGGASRGYSSRAVDRMRQKRAEKNVSSYAASMIDNDSGFKIGDWVVHADYGTGQVLAIEKSSAGTKLSVFFKNRGLKKLIAEYANLEKKSD